MNIPVLIDMSNLTKEDIGAPIENMADRLSAAGQTLVLGMVAVFAVLAILWIVLAVMGRFFTGASPRSEKKEKAPAASAPKAVQTAPAPTAPESNDEEIVAAITAAISVMLDKPQSAFRVVSFRQTSREAFRRSNINKN